MFEEALRDGVVPPGGRAEGFVYFPRPLRALGDVTFRAQLVDAHTGPVVGTAELPFVKD